MKVIAWVLIVIALGLFWISIRSQEYQMEYTIAALVTWGIAFLFNRWVKKRE